MPDVRIRRTGARQRRLVRVADWRDVLVPTETLHVPCPPGLHRATYERLVRHYNRLLGQLAALPTRRLAPHLRTAYEHQFLNHIVRIRRRLGLRTPAPRSRAWYRTGEAALFLGVSTKSLLRWTASGFIHCERAGTWAHRYYAVDELVRVRLRLNG